MKKTDLVLLFVIMFGSIGLGATLMYAYDHAATVHAASPTRVEKLSDEGMSGSLGYSKQFDFYHDKGSGVEFVCSSISGYHEYAVSCFPTGRKW